MSAEVGADGGPAADGTNRDGLALLHARLLDGGLDDDGQARLRALLADPAQRRALAALMRVDGALCELLRAGDLTPSARIEVVSTRSRRRPPARPAWPYALAAALVAAVGVAGWWLGRRSVPAAPPAVARPAPVPPEPVAEEVLARWAGEDRAPLHAGDAAQGPGELLLADGSRLELDAATRLVLGSVGTIAQEAGSLRVEAVHRPQDRRLAVHTPHAEVRVVGTVFAIDVGPEGTRVGVDAGAVSVVPAGGAAIPLAAGEALTVASDGTPHPAPATRWAIDLLGDARRGWHGDLVADGLALAWDAETSQQWKTPTWNVRVPDPGRLGLAGFDPGASLRWTVSLRRTTAVAVNLQMWSDDGSRWLGSVQRAQDLPAGRHELIWPLATFTPQQGVTSAAMRGRPIRRLAIIGWDGEAGIVVHRLALGR